MLLLLPSLVQALGQIKGTLHFRCEVYLFVEKLYLVNSFNFSYSFVAGGLDYWKQDIDEGAVEHSPALS